MLNTVGHAFAKLANHFEGVKSIDVSGQNAKLGSIICYIIIYSVFLNIKHCRKILYICLNLS